MNGRLSVYQVALLLSFSKGSVPLQKYPSGTGSVKDVSVFDDTVDW